MSGGHTLPMASGSATEVMHSPTLAETTFIRIDALAIEDALAVSASPGSLLLEISDESEVVFGGRTAMHARTKVLAAGPPGLVDRHPLANRARCISRPDLVLLPGLVNAHAHLDLTHIGPQPHDRDRGFIGFVDLVRSCRAQDDEAIAASVRLGIEQSLLGGVVAVGDIAGAAGGVPRIAAYEALADSPLWGVSFLEFFGIGAGEESGADRLVDAVQEGAALARGRYAERRVKLGLQPHAPYSVSRRNYMRAIELAQRHSLPLATHLSETPEEIEFIRSGAGPQRELLERLGVWSESILDDAGRGKTPVAHLSPVLRYGDFLAAHVNYASNEDIMSLAESRTAVVYCPRSAVYFDAAASFGPHRFIDMLLCGTRVALGTDSIINLPRGEWVGGTESGISILDEMRLLYRRDAVTAITVLGMATMDGAAALGLDPLSFTFKRGATIAGVVGVPVTEFNPKSELDLALDRIMLGGGRPELLLIGK